MMKWLSLLVYYLWKLYSSPPIQRHILTPFWLLGGKVFPLVLKDDYNRFTCNLYVITVFLYFRVFNNQT